MREMRRGSSSDGSLEAVPGLWVGNALIPLVVVSIFLLFIGAGSLVATSLMYINYDDMPEIIFHIWVGVPILLVSLSCIVAAISSSRIAFIFLLIISALTMVVCTYGAMSSGIVLYEDQWNAINDDLNDDKCTTSTALKRCTCPSVLFTTSIGTDTNCDDLEVVAKSFITEVALAGIGALFCFFAAFLALIVLFCRPWMMPVKTGYKQNIFNDHEDGGIQIIGRHDINTTGRYNGR